MSKLTKIQVRLFGRNVSILIVIIILVSCVVCCGIGLILPKPEQTADVTVEKTVGLVSEPTNTPQLTNTPKPTETPNPTETPKPTNTPQLTNTPKPTETPEAASSIELDLYASGSLGVNRMVWEQKHKPDAGSSLDTYDNLKYRIMFLDDKIYHFDVTLSNGELSLEDARAMIEVYLPDDSEFVKTYIPAHADYLKVDVYKSESLKGRFEYDWIWDDSEPGTFIVIYELYSDGSSAIIAPGNNP